MIYYLMVMHIETMTDVRKLLLRFQSIIYTGDRLADLQLMEKELDELYQSGMIEQDDYRHARIIIKSEKQKKGSD